ncbi:MAG TPA: cytochrome c-type biogenesis protein CcmH [Acidimicrobiales bacterium]|jgi:cytochrome c-type biogenesis protein CcmH
MSDRSPRFPLWLRVAMPFVVLVVALVVGSGVFDSKPQSNGQRAGAIEAVVRCPSCVDVSVANSEESTAIAVRHEIAREVAAGQSTGQIEQRLVSEYGPSILLEPPDTGGISLIWVVPIVLGAGTIGLVAVLFWRRTRQFGSLQTESAS